MFGVKVKRIKTSTNYSMEDFYAAIKDKPFTAGTPSLIKHGLVPMIIFPALDNRNQVQIIAAGKAKFQIQKGEEAGLTNMAVNMALNDLTGGLAGLKGVAGSKAKQCEELVDITVKELEALNL